MKHLIAFIFTAFFTLTAFATADNIYTRANYPQPRLLDNTSRVYPVVVNYTTDGVGNVMPMGPITSGQWKYATPVASPITTTATQSLVSASASTIHYVSALSAYNSSATATVAKIVDGSTVIWSGYLPATSGKVELQFNPPLKATSSTTVSFGVESAGASVYVSAQGFSR